MKILIRKEAEQDIASARDWYQQQSPRAAQQFIAALNHTLIRIADFPHAFPSIGKSTQRALLGRFPYTIYFSTNGNPLKVFPTLAAMNNHLAIWDQPACGSENGSPDTDEGLGAGWRCRSERRRKSLRHTREIGPNSRPWCRTKVETLCTGGNVGYRKRR